jgi:sporulation protein YlmC with PRC-barrel domain
MKRLSILTLSIFTLSLFFTATAMSAGERTGTRDTTGATGTTATGQQQAQAVQQNLKKADDITGMEVHNLQGENLGSIDSLVIDVQQGQIAYVIVSAGGVLGVGGEDRAIPFNALRLDPMQEDVLTLDIDQQRFENAPVVDVDQLDRQRGQEIHQFYGVSPYWEESGQQRSPMQQQQQQPGQQQPGQTPGSRY